jgi:hypothetical protein
MTAVLSTRARAFDAAWRGLGCCAIEDTTISSLARFSSLAETNLRAEFF